jgi:hypothetical protein
MKKKDKDYMEGFQHANEFMLRILRKKYPSIFTDGVVEELQKDVLDVVINGVEILDKKYPSINRSFYIKDLRKCGIYH